MSLNQKIVDQLSIAEKLCDTFEYDKAKMILEKLESKVQEFKDSKDIHKFHLLAGICDYEKHEFEAAITHFSKCIQIIDDSSGGNNSFLRKHTALHELSLCYFACFQQTKQSSDLQRAIEFCQQALNECIDYSLAKKVTGFMEYYIESPEHYLPELVQLATLYQAENDFEKSNSLLEVAKTCCKRHSEWRTLGVIYDELGSNNRCLGKIEEALYYYGKALKVKMFIGNERGLNVTTDNIIICLMQAKAQKLEIIENPDSLTFQQISEGESL